MPLEPLGATSIDTATEESSGLHNSWPAMARVVYGLKTRFNDTGTLLLFDDRWISTTNG